MKHLLKFVETWATHTDKRIVICISGHGAAGKTTFANELKNLLNPNEVNILNTDPYIVDSQVRNNALITYEYQNDEHRYKMTACHPAAHHLPSLERDVRMVKDGVDFYTIDTHYAKSERITSHKRITIVEGMSAAFIDPQLFDLRIYFYTDGKTEFRRRANRDITERGMDMDTLRQSHHERRIQYEVFMHSYHQCFDIVVKNSEDITFLNTEIK